MLPEQGKSCNHEKFEKVTTKSTKEKHQVHEDKGGGQRYQKDCFLRVISAFTLFVHQPNNVNALKIRVLPVFLRALRGSVLLM